VTQRHEAFSRYRPRKDVDPAPHDITDSERELITTKMARGAAVPAKLVRKLLRLSDERLARIVELERVAFPLVDRSK
jgi:hypothetical protein